MPEIDPGTGQRIAECARALSIARMNLERAKTWEEKQYHQHLFDEAERQMQEAAMVVNRGISRVAPEA